MTKLRIYPGGKFDAAVDAAGSLMVHNLALASFRITGTAGDNVLADIGQPVLLHGKGCLSLAVQNTSDAALTDLAVLAQAHPLAAWLPVVRGDDFASAAQLVFSGRSPSGQYAHTLAAGEAVFVDLDLRAPYALKFQAAAAGSGKSLAIYGSAVGR